ncbi:MAG: hypothetical protein HY370_04645 [Proteobacteria bacterium]|nr:hypothetical protein [Pseudomonadota bacterium]
MTISIIPIAGRADSACRNDAYSVALKNSANIVPLVLDILPVYELGGCGPAALKSAFEKAIADCGEDDRCRLRRAARKELRRQGFPVTLR